MDHQKLCLFLHALLLLAWSYSPRVATSTPLRADLTFDSSLHRYLVKLPLGTPPQPQEAVLRLDASLSIINCRTSFAPSKSSTFHTAVGRLHGLSEDTLTLNATNGAPPVTLVAVQYVEFRCGSTAGVAALGSSKLALPAQLAAKGPSLVPTFAYCLPSGPLFLGGSSTYLVRGGPTGAYRNLSDLFVHTVLHIGTVNAAASSPYSLSVKDIIVNTKSLSIRRPFRLYISSTQLYIQLKRPLYLSLRNAFRVSVGYGNTTQPVRAVKPFDTCFNSTKISSTRVGPGVAEIDLKMTDGALWQVFGLNSVVSVADNVLCLAFVDSGQKGPSVLGTYQQEENFVQFDLRRSVFSYTGLLDFYQTTCENFLSG